MKVMVISAEWIRRAFGEDYTSYEPRSDSRVLVDPKFAYGWMFIQGTLVIAPTFSLAVVHAAYWLRGCSPEEASGELNEAVRLYSLDKRATIGSFINDRGEIWGWGYIGSELFTPYHMRRKIKDAVAGLVRKGVLETRESLARRSR